jgi:hypothetical protein
MGNFISCYLIIGAVIAFITDITIHNTKSSEQLTFSEIAACILVWPFVILRATRNLFDNEN